LEGANFKDKWSPALQIRTVLLSIQALLSAPNPDDPLANDVAQHWKSDQDAAIATGVSTCQVTNPKQQRNGLQDTLLELEQSMATTEQAKFCLKMNML
jgi:hypothetical protein